MDGLGPATRKGEIIDACDSRRVDHSDPAVPQVADKLAVRQMIHSCANFVDRRGASDQMARFTEDANFANGRNPL
jgi:hypothetical protein